MSHSTIVVWLEGPLQSWGNDSRFGRRDTEVFPSRSGLCGLLCAALGAGGPQADLLKKWAELKVSIRAYSLGSKMSGENPFPPTLKDFHMVGNGYNGKDAWENLHIPKTNLGKKAVGGGAKLTYRYYLQDACFAALITGVAGEIAKLKAALIDPAWDLSLGRKCCPPTEFIYQGIFAVASDAVEKSDSLAISKGRQLAFEVLEGRHEGEVITVNDVPVQFGPQKRYRDRSITIVKHV